MSKKFDHNLTGAVFNNYPELRRAEYYVSENGIESGKSLSGLICTDVYPAGSGIQGTIFPQPLEELIFRRLIWSTDGEELFFGLERDEIRPLQPLLKSVNPGMLEHAENSHGENFYSIGLSIFQRGIPLGALVFRFSHGTKREKIENILDQADRILEGVFSGKFEFIWPRFSSFSSGWMARFGENPERNSLPLDMDKIRSALGDSVPLFFREVIPGFFKRIPGQLREMECSLGEEDFDSLCRGNHRIKGASASMYMSGIQRASMFLEKMIEQRVVEEIQRAFEDLKIELEILAGFCATISNDPGDN